MPNTFSVINPATGNFLEEFTIIDDNTLNQKIEKAQIAFNQLKKLSLNEKNNLIRNAATILKDNISTYTNLITREMGKPCAQAHAEIDKCAWVCNYYADNSSDFLKDVHIETDFSKSYITYNPLGIIFAIMPWNFPFWQVFRFAVPNLLSGNVVLLKHSPNTTGTAEAIERIFLEAGFPDGAFQNLIINNNQAAEVIADNRVQGVTFTGSTRTGRIIAAQAGKFLKKTVLELGGSDAYIILEDADIENAATQSVLGRMLNSGQSCIAAKRFIVHKSVVREFTDSVVSKMQNYQPGDPFSCSINFGPLARLDLRDNIANQVNRSIDMGAKLLLGGNIPNRKGYYYEATVLADVTPNMPCFFEETFGPVAVISSFETEDEAISLANMSEFGLGAAVFTKNIEKGEFIARNHLAAGSCFVNDFVKSDPRLPFGGIKNSGYGRELSLIGMHEFMNTKTVCVK